MKVRMRAGAVVAAVAVALGTGAVAEAGSAAKTKITLKNLSATGASGKVKSKKGSCKGGRTVTLFTYEGFSSRKVETTKSSSSGAWKIERELKAGDYFAKADAKAGCRYAVSKELTLAG